MPVVSVVIPLYNAERFIGQTLSSVLQQTLSSIEVIVIDDGSTDEGSDVVLRLAATDPRVALYRFDNAGVVAARNRGLERVKSEYVAFLDCDDVWYPHLLERQVGALAARPDAVMASAWMRYMSASGREFGVMGRATEEIDRDSVMTGAVIPSSTPSAALFRTEAVRRIGGFVDLCERSVQVDDVLLYGRLAQLGEVIITPEVLGAYRVHDTSARMTGEKLMGAGVAYTRRTLRDASFPDLVPWPEFLAAYVPPRRRLRSQRAQMIYRRGAIAALDRRWAAAARDLAHAFVLSPREIADRAWRQLGPTKRHESVPRPDPTSRRR